MESSTSHIDYVEEKAEEVRKYFEFTNSILGSVSIALAIACVSTDNPVFFGWICFVFVTYIWVKGITRFKTALADIQEANHEVGSFKYFAKNSVPAFIGMAVLLAVVSEIVCSNGICT